MTSNFQHFMKEHVRRTGDEDVLTHINTIYNAYVCYSEQKFPSDPIVKRGVARRCLQDRFGRPPPEKPDMFGCVLVDLDK